MLFAAPALGAARRALAVWTEWAAGSPGENAYPASVLGRSGTARDALARSSAEIDAVHLLWREALQRADAGPTDASAVARNRRDAAVGIELLVTAVERLFRTGGSPARSATGELQRCWRDVHTVATHGALALEPAAQAYALETAQRI